MPRDGHYIKRIAWLRAAVLGANDGILSTASLIVGVAAAGLARGDILLAGVAGISAGALSMAAGEYVSVSAQADLERADLARERRALHDNPDYELDELCEALQDRGISAPLARAAAKELTEHDALDAHAREELGMTSETRARPWRAALAGGISFTLGAAIPMLGAMVATVELIIPAVAAVTLAAMATLGAASAWSGGAPIVQAVRRVVLWGCLAMLVTAAIGNAVEGVL